MAIQDHPSPGSILMCDFNSGFKEPEMVKRRPVIVLSPKIAARPKLCTVVALSTTAPQAIQPYHCMVTFDPTLPPPFNAKEMWVKGDMIYSAGFHRLDLIRLGTRENGKRQYYFKTLSADDMKHVRTCVLRGLGLSTLTKHLP